MSFIRTKLSLGGTLKRRVAVQQVRSFTRPCQKLRQLSADQTARTKRDPVRVQFDGHAGNLSPILLRDLCSCPRCVDPSTKQKSFSTTDIPAEIRAESVTTSEDGLHIKWTNDIPGFDVDHTSKIPLSILRNLRTVGTTVPKMIAPRRVLWDSQMYEGQCPDVDYQQYMNDPRTLFDVVKQLHTHGLAFITNVPESEESVSIVAERIGPLKTTFYGRTWDVRSTPEAINVAYTAQNLGFHMDLMYMEQPPHIQLLHCIRSSSAGGASLFTDSFKSAADLADADYPAFEGLVQGRIDFHYDHPGSQYYHQARTVIEGYNRSSHASGSDHGSVIDHIDAIAWSPPFQAPFYMAAESNGDQAGGQSLGADLERWHDDARKFDELVHRPEGIYERIMKPGECVLFDNRRVLHARRAFEVGDLGKERWLRGAYIDKDPFMSQLKILTDQFGES